VDIGTGLTVAASSPLISKVLGPTADYLGAGLQSLAARGLKNVERVFVNAAERLGKELDAPGVVPPRVLKGILQEAPFCDDELAAEYFGGVLASSRSEVGRDDRGATFTSLIARLSVYQIRSHFLFYSVVRGIYVGCGENIGHSSGRRKLRTFVPWNAYVMAMEFDKNERAEIMMAHVMFGLAREALVEGDFLFGNPEHIRTQYPGADQPGILFSPSALGVELFLWAHGKGDMMVNDIINPAVDLEPGTKITMMPGIRSTEFSDRVLEFDPK
jgi:hypothetical protein